MIALYPTEPLHDYAMGRLWTGEEKEFLALNGKGMFVWQIASILGRTTNAVRSMCQKLDVSFPFSPPPVFSQEEYFRWVGDKANYATQHKRAIKDFPNPLGACEICGVNEAIDRARIDHTNLPYRKEYVVFMCRSCNEKHNLRHSGGTPIEGGFVVLFQEVA